jgi:hypothetical protein
MCQYFLGSPYSLFIVVNECAMMSARAVETGVPEDLERVTLLRPLPGAFERPE